MKLTGVVGAIIGGLVGALAWGAVAKFLHLEVGYVAWGVGLAVGFLSYAFGGRGIANGVLCAIVALCGIYGGKVLAMKWTATEDDILSEMQSNELFKEMSEEQKTSFAKEAAANITWSDAASAATEELDIMDIIFAVLGIGTAFKLGAAPEEHTPAGPMKQSPLSGTPQPGPDVRPPSSTGAPPATPYTGATVPEPAPTSPAAHDPSPPIAEEPPITAPPPTVEPEDEPNRPAV